MPNIIVTEADFAKLSETTQKELLDMLKASFSKVNFGQLDSSIGGVEGSRLKDFWDKHHGIENWFEQRNEIRRSRDPYGAYEQLTKQLHMRLNKFITSTGPVKVDGISLEVAIAIILGLNKESKAVIQKIYSRGMATREEIAQVLGDEKKINGTIGSINRRYRGRFDPSLCKVTDQLRLVEYDKETQKYFFTINGSVFDHALKIINAGYKLSVGNISLKSKNGKEVLIEELAIEMAEQGKTFSNSVYFSTDGEIEEISINANMASTAASANFIWEVNGVDEWFDDEGDCVGDAIEIHNSGYDISFGANMPWLENRRMSEEQLREQEYHRRLKLQEDQEKRQKEEYERIREQEKQEKLRLEKIALEEEKKAAEMQARKTIDD